MYIYIYDKSIFWLKYYIFWLKSIGSRYLALAHCVRLTTIRRQCPAVNHFFSGLRPSHAPMHAALLAPLPMVIQHFHLYHIKVFPPLHPLHLSVHPLESLLRIVRNCLLPLNALVILPFLDSAHALALLPQHVKTYNLKIVLDTLTRNWRNYNTMRLRPSYLPSLSMSTDHGSGNCDIHYKIISRWSHLLNPRSSTTKSFSVLFSLTLCLYHMPILLSTMMKRFFGLLHQRNTVFGQIEHWQLMQQWTLHQFSINRKGGNYVALLQ